MNHFDLKIIFELQRFNPFQACGESPHIVASHPIIRYSKLLFRELESFCVWTYLNASSSMMLILLFINRADSTVELSITSFSRTSISASTTSTCVKYGTGKSAKRKDIGQKRKIIQNLHAQKVHERSLQAEKADSKDDRQLFFHHP